jgi:signal transduction histidine kinase
MELRTSGSVARKSDHDATEAVQHISPNVKKGKDKWFTNYEHQARFTVLPLTSSKCQGQENVDLDIYSPGRLPTAVPN